MNAKPMFMLIATQLKKQRGWTDTDICKFLPTPCDTRPNPNYKSGPPMKLYGEARVIDIENSDEFKAREPERKKGKAAAALALETKEKNMKQLAKRLIDSLRIQSLPPYPKLLGMALSSKRHYEMSRGNYDIDYSDIDTETAERWVENFVRHEKSNYDFVWTQVKGKVGAGKAYNEIRDAIDKKIEDAIQATKVV